MSDMNWREKNDLDLTSEDIDAMVAEGRPVDVRGPSLPPGLLVVGTNAGSPPASQQTLEKLPDAVKQIATRPRETANSAAS